MAIQDFFKPLVSLEEQNAFDGMGGFETKYIEKMSFIGGISTDNASESKIAEKNTPTTTFTLTTMKDVEINYGNLIKDAETGNIYKITSDPNDMIIPKKSKLNIKSCSIERVFLKI